MDKEKNSSPSPEEILGGRKKSDKKKKKTVHKHTHIEHHSDGSHTVRHTPVDGSPEVSYAAQDLDGVHKGIDENVGAPQEAEAVPPPGAMPAPPMAQGA